MSWKVAFPLGLAAVGIVAVAAESNLTLASKPSIRLRVMTGALPTADLDGKLAAEEARLAQEQAAGAAAASQAKELRILNSAANQVYDHLKNRVSAWEAAPSIQSIGGSQ